MLKRIIITGASDGLWLAFAKLCKNPGGGGSYPNYKS